MQAGAPNANTQNGNGMLSRFQGPESTRRLIAALRLQHIVQDDEKLAELHARSSFVKERAMIPTENTYGYAEMPVEVSDKLQNDFYSNTSQVPFRALVET
jgi:hypothetical protein